MKEFEIKQLSAIHANDMASLHAHGFSPAWSAEEFARHCDRELDAVWGAMLSGKLIGFIILRIQHDQAEVLTIIIDPTQRAQGCGAALLGAAENAAEKSGVEIVFLDVAQDNPAAIHMYERAGYVRCGTRAGYYRRAGGRVDALLFQKRLS